jgi:hypothetical protein
MSEPVQLPVEFYAHFNAGPEVAAVVLRQIHGAVGAIAAAHGIEISTANNVETYTKAMRQIELRKSVQEFVDHIPGTSQQQLTQLRNALHRSGISTVRDILALGQQNTLTLDRVGQFGVMLLQAELSFKGFHWNTHTPMAALVELYETPEEVPGALIGVYEMHATIGSILRSQRHQQFWERAEIFRRIFYSQEPPVRG